MLHAARRAQMHPRLLEGIDHFNARRFWEAHEAWEDIWRAAAGDERQFLQGLIQLAAAYHHVQRGTLRGAPRLFEAALRRLDALPRCYGGVERQQAVESAAKDRASAVHSMECAETAVFVPVSFPQLAICAPVLHEEPGARSGG